MLCEVIDVPQKENCENCIPCMRLKLMDIGFITGQEIDIEEQKLGLHLVHILSENGHVEQTIALRVEELERICYKTK